MFTKSNLESSNYIVLVENLSFKSFYKQIQTNFYSSALYNHLISNFFS